MSIVDDLKVLFFVLAFLSFLYRVDTIYNQTEDEEILKQLASVTAPTEWMATSDNIHLISMRDHNVMWLPVSSSDYQRWETATIP